MLEGLTALIDAVRRGCAADVVALLADGADVNEPSTDGSGLTALPHKLFPAPARARAVELLRVGQWFKRLPNDFPIQFEVWEVFVMPHEVTRDYQPPQA